MTEPIINCNLIRDLLPSYLDDICTQDTKAAVNQHLADCPQCRDLAKMMQETDLISEQTQIIELDYLKKLKRRLTKELVGGMLLTAVILFGLTECITNNLFSPGVFYWVLPLLLIGTNMLLPVSARENEITKRQKTSAGIGVIITFYMLLLSVMTALNGTAQGIWLSFLDESQIGPFISMQYHAASVYLAAAYIIETCRALRTKPVSFVCMSIYLTGGCIVLAQDSCLHILSDHSLWIKLAAEAAAVPLSEGIVITLAVQFIRKHIGS